MMIQNNIDLDDIKIYLPSYLSDNDMRDITKKLLENSQDFFINTSVDYWMQGDCVSQIPYIYFENDGFISTETSALIISNTCDLDVVNNSRLYPTFATAVPIFSLQDYEKSLIEAGCSITSVQNHIQTIRNQNITSFFYLHNDNPRFQYFARFDMAFSIENKIPGIFYSSDKDALVDKRMISFSNYGFYFLLFKLSIHFTRIHEKINRDELT